MRKAEDENEKEIVRGLRIEPEPRADGAQMPYCEGPWRQRTRGPSAAVRGARHGSVATVEPCAGCSVPVLVWEITAEDEKALDSYEGFPFLYGKKMVELLLKGKTARAMVYVMTPGRLLGQPGENYYAAILEGYWTAGFDPAVLREAADWSGEELQND